MTRLETCFTDERYLRKGRRSDGDGTDSIGRENEPICRRQVQSVQEGPRHSVQPRHPVHVEERVHAGVLS